MPVNINVKTKIKINGKEYNSPDELPAEFREAYETAMANRANVPQLKFTTNSKITFNGQTFSNREEMPDEVRKIYDSTMDMLDKDHDGIPDMLQSSGASSMTSSSEPIPVTPLHPQPVSAGAERSDRWRVILTLAVVLLAVMAAAFYLLKFIH